MDILMAPLQGFTEAAFRNVFDECFGGVDEYYTPFIRLEKGVIRNKDLKDADPANNRVQKLVPQIIAATADEALFLIDKIAEWGYRSLDINMGCPFPLMVKKGRGAGILPHPDRVAQILSVVHRNPEIEFSVKLRLGWNSCEEIFALVDMLNEAPLRQITLHPRLGIQQYKGVCSLEAFSRFYEVCRKPLVYNGDLMKVSDIQKIQSQFPDLKGVMIGRGLLANPWLASEYKNGTSVSSTQKRKSFQLFHQKLLAAYSERIEGGERQLLGKMVSFWEYLLSDEDRKKIKKVRKASDMENYCRAVNELIVAL